MKITPLGEGVMTFTSKNSIRAITLKTPNAVLHDSHIDRYTKSYTLDTTQYLRFMRNVDHGRIFT